MVEVCFLLSKYQSSSFDHVQFLCQLRQKFIQYLILKLLSMVKRDAKGQRMLAFLHGKIALCSCAIQYINGVYSFSNEHHCNSDSNLFCRCIPEESNELPGKRSERSHTTPHANWQIMTICGLTLLVLILLITLFSLARHVKRLRLRLRHSAEVLVPSNTAPIIIASQRRT